MITKAVITLSDALNHEVYFVDSDNKRVSENIRITPLTSVSEIKTMADKKEREIRRKEIENKQGRLNI